jgi:hypothetical protein
MIDGAYCLAHGQLLSAGRKDKLSDTDLDKQVSKNMQVISFQKINNKYSQNN